ECGHLDMSAKPTTDELVQLITRDGRVPLDEVKRHPHGSTFPEPAVFVAPKDPGWTARLQLANPDMMADLRQVLAEPGQSALMKQSAMAEEYPFRLICRRMQHVYNSSLNDSATNHGRAYNPAFMHPTDLSELGLTSGDEIEIRSRRARIFGV